MARNALNSWCYWTLREAGLEPQQATRQIAGLNLAAKNELLFQHGVNYNELPLWQKRGVGVYWTPVEKTGTHPLTGETSITTRRVLKTDLELPMKDAYSHFIEQLLTEQVL